MSIDLEKLERAAISAASEVWEFGLGAAFVRGVQRSALWMSEKMNGGLAASHVVAASPAAVIELIRRLREAEQGSEAAIKAAVEAEREACAKVCEEQARFSGDGMTFYTATGQCASRIRERGKA